MFRRLMFTAPIALASLLTLVPAASAARGADVAATGDAAGVPQPASSSRPQSAVTDNTTCNMPSTVQQT